ncbi:hypothetical protein N475_05990 [Pseudoalteromonas luteoviolacea DSM 6061]|uniref:Uncharacterized protein n=1 Tax=Pseudoalteromonas luteoviolacea DSM 6061 TaxID=1365250 RepID=A0A167D9I8_9GAMM|nr:hypothetical protein N475_05990 [Pseudoalteromonas luteoviolacea DSM 6061]
MLRKTCKLTLIFYILLSFLPLLVNSLTLTQCVSQISRLKVSIKRPLISLNYQLDHRVRLEYFVAIEILTFATYIIVKFSINFDVKLVCDRNKTRPLHTMRIALIQSN